MFTVHTVSTRLANSMRASQRGLTSGMYLSFYYIGGAVGSIFPAIIYDKFGWDMTVFMFATLLVFIFAFILLSRKLFKAYD